LRGKSRIVEIGIGEGFTTRVLAENADDGAQVFGVDPFLRGRIGISWGLQIARAHNARYLRNGRVKFVRSLSTQVGSRIPCPVDFIFIDGDHSLGGITADWAFWSSRVKPGGIIALHDSLVVSSTFDAVKHGSTQYFESHIRGDTRFTLVGEADSLAVLQRKNELGEFHDAENRDQATMKQG
jgi:predicted O-methyltransferase YrrM